MLDALTSTADVEMVTTTVDGAPAGSVDGDDETRVEASTAPTTTATTHPSTALSTATESGVDDLDGDGTWRRRATDLLASTTLATTVDELATVLSLHDRRESKQAIADAVGRPRSTITGWIKAWEEFALVTAGAGASNE